MRLELKRKALLPEYTIGDLFIDGKLFCNTLEDTVRDLNKDGDLNDHGEGKVYGKTAIPYGTYEVVITYSNRFKKQLPLHLFARQSNLLLVSIIRTLLTQKTRCNRTNGSNNRLRQKTSNRRKKSHDGPMKNRLQFCNGFKEF